MGKGVIPVAGVMIGMLALDFIIKSKKFLGWLVTIIYTVLSVVVMEVLGIHPAFLIIGLIIYALSTKESSESKHKQKKVNN